MGVALEKPMPRRLLDHFAEVADPREPGGRSGPDLRQNRLVEADTTYYIVFPNAPISATKVANAIRAHGMIEITSHYGRNVAMRGGVLRICFTLSVFARHFKFVYSVLNANKTWALLQGRYFAVLGRIKPRLKTVWRL